MNLPPVVVCAGGGGVGKTTVSSAIAVAAARSGRRTLVVSIDPARRLADALGISLGADVREVPLHDAPDAALFALMPRPEAALRSFAELLFAREPAALERVLHNRIYQALEDSVPGIHELVAANLVGSAIGERRFDLVVIDTAPSRHAVDFVTYPERIAHLLRGRIVRWLSRLAPRPSRPSDTDSTTPPARSSYAPHASAQRLLEGVLGPAILDVAELFRELVRVRPRFVELNEAAAKLLLGNQAHYVLVAAPTGAATADAAHLRRCLADKNLVPRLVILNAVASSEPEWPATLRNGDITPAVRHALDVLAVERRDRATATRTALCALATNLPDVAQLTLPHLELADPPEIVRALADVLAVDLTRVLGESGPAQHRPP